MTKRLKYGVMNCIYLDTQTKVLFLHIFIFISIQIQIMVHPSLNQVAMKSIMHLQISEPVMLKRCLLQKSTTIQQRKKKKAEGKLTPI